MSARILATSIALAAALLGCAKISLRPEPLDTSIAPAAVPAETPTATPQAPIQSRTHVYAVSDALPPTTSPTANGGTPLSFTTVGVNTGECFVPALGGFRVCKEGYYSIQAIVNWPGSFSQVEPGASCQIFLHINASSTMFSGPYLRGLPCTAQVAIRRRLALNDWVHFSAGVTATGLNLVNVRYIYSYVSITEEKK